MSLKLSWPCMQTIPIISALALFGTIAIVCCIIISLGGPSRMWSKTPKRTPPLRHPGEQYAQHTCPIPIILHH